MLNCRKPSDPTYTAVSFNSTDPINSSCMRLLCELPEAPQAAPLARHAAQSAPCPMPLSPSLHSFHPTGDPNRRVGATADLCGLHGASVAATNHFVRTEVDYLDVDWRALMFVVSRSLFCKNPAGEHSHCHPTWLGMTQSPTVWHVPSPAPDSAACI